MTIERDALPAEYLEALARIEAAQEQYAVQQALTAARERLRMDAAYLATLDSRRQRIEAIVGDVGALGIVPGSVFPLEQTYCKRMLSGEIPNVVPDTRLEPSLRDLGVTRAVGCYIGVPVKLSDGRVHGTLCCASEECREDLGGSELRFMQVLAQIVATRVEQAEGYMAGQTERLRGRQE
jgi:GAF domain-containing protein